MPSRRPKEKPPLPQQTATRRGLLTGMDLIARGMGLGWPTERGKVGDAECVAARARDSRARSVVGCALERKGLALWLELGGNPTVFKATLQQVGALVDRAAAALARLGYFNTASSRGSTLR